MNTYIFPDLTALSLVIMLIKCEEGSEKFLPENHPVFNEDERKVIVISVPDSSNTTALGYQTELEKLGVNCRLEIGLIRSHYIGRTFIQPGQANREIGVKIKFNTVKGVLEGRTVVLVDDSIVTRNYIKTTC